MKQGLLALALSLGASGAYADSQGLTVDTIATLNKVHSVTVSPDGSQLVYGIKSPQFDDNAKSNFLYLQDLKDNTPARQITSGAGEHNVVWQQMAAAFSFLLHAVVHRKYGSCPWLVVKPFRFLICRWRLRALS